MAGFYRKRNIELKWANFTPNYFIAIFPKMFWEKVSQIFNDLQDWDTVS